MKLEIVSDFCHQFKFHYALIGVQLFKSFDSYTMFQKFRFLFGFFLNAFAAYVSIYNGMLYDNTTGTRFLLAVASVGWMVVSYQIMSLIYFKDDLKEIFDWIQQRHQMRKNDLIERIANDHYGKVIVFLAKVIK